MRTGQAKIAAIRILIVDDHAVVRSGLRMLIENSLAGKPEMRVVGMAGNRAEAVAIAASEQPDIIILDLALGDEDGLALLPELREVAKNARVLVLTGVPDVNLHRRTFRLGAMGVVLKESAAEVLLKAIDRVHRGEVWLDRSMMANVLHDMTQGDEKAIDPEEAKIAALTDRERQVVTLIAEGLKNKQIAERLFISETTVTHHLSSIFSKLGVSDRLELVIYAFSHKLAKMP